jgi:hypothetical protein
MRLRLQLLVMFVILTPLVARAQRIVSVGVEGTQFKVALDNHRILDSLALDGAVLQIALPGGDRQRIQIIEVQKDSADPDGDIFLHRMLVADPTGHWIELCTPDATGAIWAFPLGGQWNSEGFHISNNGFSLICAADALGKCVRFGYKPWRTAADGSALADYHAACVKAVRADYCGNRATTRDGQLIDIYDRLGIQHRDAVRPGETLPFEAAFAASGAVCVAHTRVPEQATLGQLETSCPRLAGRLGQKACVEADAVMGRYDSPLIFIRSPDSARTTPPPVVTPVERSAGSSGWSVSRTGAN